MIHPMFNPASTDDNGNPNWVGMYTQYHGLNYPDPPNCAPFGP